jgi:hypothetical protein
MAIDATTSFSYGEPKFSLEPAARHRRNAPAEATYCGKIS